MALIQQIDDFTAFAKSLSQQEGEEISIDDVYARWWQERHRSDDLAALQEAHAEYDSGQRGELAREELAAFRAERGAGRNP